MVQAKAQKSLTRKEKKHSIHPTFHTPTHNFCQKLEQKPWEQSLSGSKIHTSIVLITLISR